MSTVAVAGIAAWSSWSHMVAVALRFGERPEVAYVLPLSVDGMLVVASAAMVEDKRAGRRVRWSARVAFIAGVVASVAANIAAAQPSLGARIVAAWPAVALLLVVEMLTRSQPVPRRRQVLSDDTLHMQRELPPSDATAAALTASHPTAMSTSEPTRQAQPKAVTEDPAVGQQPIPLPQQTTRPAKARQRTTVTGDRTADIVARLRAERPQASLTELASAAGVSKRHVRRLLANESDSSAVAANEHDRQGQLPRTTGIDQRVEVPGSTTDTPQHRQQ
ncbi:DUF2637 domain-containing protein [Polymorphospora rubra]|uniref:DUF2637 domain-containing protein n=1 Tax=Polymorphospora rubra TaxID=338584 RepID=UPI0033C5BD13